MTLEFLTQGQKINTTLSLQQSEVANRQVTEATRQEKTVMTFTFATVLFILTVEISFHYRSCLPCLLWTLPRFNKLQLGLPTLSVTIPLTVRNLVLVSIGISTILGLGVFYWENVKQVRENILHITMTACKHAFKLTLDLSIVSNDITDDKKMANKLSILLKTEGQEQGIMSRFKGHGRRIKIDEVENTITRRDKTL
ncbi:unnamed protein product [Fusarium fujikuroi]|uniref:Uncharacterized protein n=1 Tax=Fusarium fujikuroi TaxID=5127 RepID=A0A9Q9RWH7_FUSFU|nr:unnamed protein product [Fusarium fujikuroi]VZI11746.1 unnamed protein product [Fusarium fujikuroi]